MGVCQDDFTQKADLLNKSDDDGDRRAKNLKKSYERPQIHSKSTKKPRKSYNHSKSVELKIAKIDFYPCTTTLLYGELPSFPMMVKGNALNSHDLQVP